MKKLSKIVLAGLLAVSTTAFAQNAGGNALYGEIGHTWLKYSESGYSMRPTVVRAILGAEIHPNVAVEGMLGFGASDGKVDVAGYEVKGSVDNTYGLYLKPRFAITPELEVFARLGWARSKVTASAVGLSISDSGSDASYGIGASYRFGKSWYGSFDYASYYSKNGVKVDGATLAIGTRF